MVDGYWFDVLPEDYIIEVSDNSTMCTFCIEQSYSSTSSSYWSEVPVGTITLGRRFLYDYYTTFNVVDGTLDMVIKSGGSRTTPVAGSTPSTEIPRGVSLIKPNPAALITVPLALGTFASVAWLFWRMYEFYVVGDDTFVVFPWSLAVDAVEDNAMAFVGM